METVVVESLREALVVICCVSAPALLAALVIGLTVSFIQAVTQIQEQTVSLVPKLIGVCVVVLVSISWMIQTIVTFTRKILMHLPQLSIQ